MWQKPLTKQNTHKRKTPIVPAGFGPAIPTVERPQTRTLDRVGCGNYRPKVRHIMRIFFCRLMTISVYIL